MDVREFQNGVLQTASCDWEKIKYRLASQLASTRLPWVVDWMHSLMGIQSEFVELLGAKDDENLIEELGDILWYITLGLNSFNKTLELPDMKEFVRSHEFVDEVDKLIHAFLFSLGDMFSEYKAHIFYGRAVNEDEMVSCLRSMSDSVFSLAHSLKVSPFELMASNQEKLRNKFKGRYKTGTFSEEDANIRDVNSEYEAMRLAEAKDV